MILSDRTIRDEIAAGRIVIEPFEPECVQPSSVDLHLDRWFRVFRNHTLGHIDVRQNLEELTELVSVEDDVPFILHPGEFVLGSTIERVALPADLVGRLEGKSSLGRLGLLIHSTAGFVANCRAWVTRLVASGTCVMDMSMTWRGGAQR